jgi:hypothetical protein
MRSDLGGVQQNSFLAETDSRNLLDERGYKLAAPVRRLMERGLGADFGNVVLHVSRLCDRANRRLGARAFAYGNHIGIAEEAFDLDSEAGLRLLAHELAHVVQQRQGVSTRGSVQPRRRWLEQEADRAAEAVLCGFAYTCELGDGRGVPACWDIAGHYYTPYLIFLNAGVNRDVAQRLALWCWLPDQVEEFDAAHVGIHSFIYSSAWHHAKDTYPKYDAHYFMSEEQYVRAVQEGLHVLTGASSAEETKRRAKIFSESTDEVKILFRGISLHPFGDCFAHRDLDDDRLLYGKHEPFGHAFAGHSPDNIFDKRRANIYIAYVRGLDELAMKYSGGKRIVGIDDVVIALSAMLRGMPLQADGHKQLAGKWSDLNEKVRKLAELNVPESEEGCCTHIRKVASDLVGIAMSSRHPNEESVPWKDYYARLRGWIVQDSGGKHDSELIFYKVLNLAVQWGKVSLRAKGAKAFPRKRAS